MSKSGQVLGSIPCFNIDDVRILVQPCAERMTDTMLESHTVWQPDMLQEMHRTLLLQ
jgi:hypothetical protein